MPRKFLLIDRLVPLAARVREQWEDGTLRFPPTDIFNREWMLKASLDAVEDDCPGCCCDHPLCITPTDIWRTDVLLESPFQPRFPGDHLGEGPMKAPAVIGNLAPEPGPGGALRLAPNCRRFSVILPVLYEDPLPGTPAFPWYNAVARTAACMARTVEASGLRADSVPHMYIGLLAPDHLGLYSDIRELLTTAAVRGMVGSRVNCYRDEDGKCVDQLYSWLHEFYTPFSRKLRVDLLDWGAELSNYMICRFSKLMWFYLGCLYFNDPEGPRPGKLFPPSPREMPRGNGKAGI